MATKYSVPQLSGNFAIYFVQKAQSGTKICQNGGFLPKKGGGG